MSTVPPPAQATGWTPSARSGNFEASRAALDGPVLVSGRRFGDHRGAFAETYTLRDFEAIGIADAFVQDNFSWSAGVGTLRGLHFQTPPHAQAKLVRVLRGRILDVAVDLRAGSPTYGQHVAAELSAENGLQLYVPVGFAHGFCTLEPDTEVAYKVTDTYAPDCDKGLLWNDPALAIEWPVGPDAAILSEKDQRQPLLRDLPPNLFA
ncbi:dTDP-4-dehydrorhamnose 3,5-epimerase [Roseomonas sp. KE0001]|uniref:dTDP-4-dehydrorhamnose 3,5-epimerase n=1 Tax=Roseomonas sp. KE0001 TaxID=2479201 RepID=UPI0018E04B42|nr:dTDP-4-dehydrorhamnose 3,5-epimerase [Roseomonas sp. KE0001]MBI0435228.1 dTDP-4-dehydrorhamnose 3,5-epimerase [Roseomonas sp. KE0001]